MAPKSTWILTLMIHRLLNCISGVILLCSVLLSLANANDLLVSKPAPVDAPELIVRRALPASSTSLICPPESLPAKPADVVEKPFHKTHRTPRGVRMWKVFQDDVTELFRTEIPDLSGLPLLHYAVLLDDAEWVDQLIAHGADLK